MSPELILEFFKGVGPLVGVLVITMYLYWDNTRRKNGDKYVTVKDLELSLARQELRIAEGGRLFEQRITDIIENKLAN